MAYRRGAAVAAIVAALAVPTVAVAGPAEAGPGDSTATAATATATGWVVENPSANGVFETNAGSTTVGGTAGGGTISCPVVSGWGRADSGTLRPNDFFGETGVTNATPCTGGPGAAGLEVISSPGTVFVPETYDTAADRISGSAYPWLWGLFLEAPDCQVDLYAVDPNAPVPFTYDNPTGTLDAGPFDVVVTRAEGAGCADLAAVGDELTYDTTLVATPAFTVRPA